MSSCARSGGARARAAAIRYSSRKNHKPLNNGSRLFPAGGGGRPGRAGCFGLKMEKCVSSSTDSILIKTKVSFIGILRPNS
jgi:hypothetical protein